MITVAVCDDSKKMVDSVVGSLERYAEENNVELKIVSFFSGIDFLEQFDGTYDILFLDIKMPEMDGIMVAEKLRMRDKKIIIIFLTSLLQRAVDGYKVNAFNYILKPMGNKRLQIEMERCIRKLDEDNEDSFVVFNNEVGSSKVLLRNIYFIETSNRNLKVHTTQGNYTCYWTLKEFESRIKEKGFLRSHFSFLVNLKYVEGIGKQDIRLITGEEIPLSKAKKKAFVEKLAIRWRDML